MKSDSEQIWDLLVHYCHLVDTGRGTQVGEEIFTEDAIDDHGQGVVQGRAAINAMFAGFSDVLEATFHSLSNYTVEVNGDTARARCCATAWHWSRTDSGEGRLRPADFVAVGGYIDELRRVDGRWLISHRRCHLVGKGLVIGGVTPELESMMDNLAANGPLGEMAR